jgi:phage FluMu protein Com
MERDFPMPMTIRCFRCGKVYEVAFTSDERHEFSCPACGKVEVYNLRAMGERGAAADAKRIRKSGGGR